MAFKRVQIPQTEPVIPDKSEPLLISNEDKFLVHFDGATRGKHPKSYSTHPAQVLILLFVAQTIYITVTA
jgi:hypothetical protein